MENKIYKEAILDAKALRASAIANAKSMMQEAIEPAIQEMMRLKLSEELEEDTLEEDDYEESTYEEGADYGVEEGTGDEVTEATLEEILAELNALEEDSTLNEAEDEDEADDDVEAGDETASDSKPEKVADTKEIRLSFGELKDALFPYVEKDEEGEEDMEAGAEGGDEAPVSLDEILAELEEKEHGMKKEEEKENMNEFLQGQSLGQSIGGFVQSILSKMGISTGGIDLADLGGIVGSVAGMGGIILSAILLGKAGEAKAAKQLEPIKDKIQAAIDAKSGGTSGEQTDSLGEASKDHSMKKELEMANETIETLRESINEINLLNAKLLYMNKIFKAKNLTESQKVKVVKAFDRSSSVKEVKNTYEVLKESIETKKSQLKESVGFASKPIGSVAKNNIIEADPFINRWQKIAGIK